MASNLNKSEMILSVRGNLNVGYHDHIGCIDNSALGGIPYYRGVAVRNNMAVHQAAAGNHFGLPRFGMLRYNPADPPRGKVLQISWKHSFRIKEKMPRVALCYPRCVLYSVACTD